MRGQLNNTQIVARHLRRHGTITPAEALIVHKIQRLAPRIQELRKYNGMPIETVECRDDAGDRYFKYILRDELF